MKNITSLSLLIFLIIFAYSGHNHDSYSQTNTCLPENSDNKRVVDKAITSPAWAFVWQTHNITGVTPQNVEYVLSNDPKCTALLSKYDQFMQQTFTNTSYLKYTFTFHKYQNYYFVMRMLNNPPNMIVTGSSPFYILDQDLNFIEGMAM